MNELIAEIVRATEEISKVLADRPKELWFIPVKELVHLGSTFAADCRAHWPEMRTLCIDTETWLLRPLDFDVPLAKMPKSPLLSLSHVDPLDVGWKPFPPGC